MILRRYKEKVLPVIEEPVEDETNKGENQESNTDSGNAVIEKPAEDEVADAKQKSTKKK